MHFARATLQIAIRRKFRALWSCLTPFIQQMRSGKGLSLRANANYPGEVGGQVEDDDLTLHLDGKKNEAPGFAGGFLGATCLECLLYFFDPASGSSKTIFPAKGGPASSFHLALCSAVSRVIIL